MEKLDRITPRPETMGGKACIRALRVTVREYDRRANRNRARG
jgi:uncharacterized protein (DUF433 family)